MLHSSCRWPPRWAALLLPLALLTHAVGCEEAPTEPLPPSADPAEGAAPETPPEPEIFAEHTVIEGQTLWDIARSYHVSVNEIMEANEMRPRDVRRMSKGRVLRIPGASEAVEVERVRPPTLEELPPLEGAAYHFLAQGETLWDLSRSYDKTLDEILARNEFSDDDVRSLRPGRAIIIPGLAQSAVRVAERSARTGIQHTVAPGETVWDLARAFHVSVSELMSANRMSEADVSRLRSGQTLFIPGVTQDRSGRVRRGLSRRQEQALARARRLGLGTRRAGRMLLHGRVEDRWVRAAGGNENRFPGTLRWPVSNGRYVRGFGSGEGGYHLALDIAGDIGWNVRASAAGIVGFSGDEIPGYGNVVLIIHPGGWVTMYAHNSVNFVVAGERVPAGGIVAELGSTGISRGPHVHYEFIYDGKNCDPATLFRPGVRHRSRLARIPRETWTRPNNRPPGVKCHPRRRHPRSRWVVHEDPTEGSGN